MTGPSEQWRGATSSRRASQDPENACAQDAGHLEPSGRGKLFWLLKCLGGFVFTAFTANGQRSYHIDEEDMIKTPEEIWLDPRSFEADVVTFQGAEKFVRANRIEELEAKLASMLQSKEHFKRSANTQKARCKRLRHKQRALLASLQKVKDCKTLDDAKFAAHIGMNGWADDELVYQSRTTLAELTGGEDE